MEPSEKNLRRDTKRCAIVILCGVLTVAFVLGEFLLLPHLAQLRQVLYSPLDTLYMSFTRPIGLLATAMFIQLTLLYHTTAPSRKGYARLILLGYLVLILLYYLLLLLWVVVPSFPGFNGVVFKIATNYSWGIAIFSAIFAHEAVAGMKGKSHPA